MRPATVRTAHRKRNAVGRARPRKVAPDISWIQALAAPYLRGYRASAVVRGPLRGYRFTAPARRRGKAKAGFFVGYVLESRNFDFLSVVPPECTIFAFIEPVGSAFHSETVAREGSLLRKTTEYIGWLTHRPPRFAFFDDREIALVRHFSMQTWPEPKHAHYSRNFFIETLAWLVRSGLVAKLRNEKRD